jgi:hypothetical protein
MNTAAAWKYHRRCEINALYEEYCRGPVRAQVRRKQSRSAFGEALIRVLRKRS